MANGDEQMRNLMALGEPERSERALGDLLTRVHDIERELS